MDVFLQLVPPLPHALLCFSGLYIYIHDNLENKLNYFAYDLRLMIFHWQTYEC